MPEIKIGHLNAHNNSQALQEALSWKCSSLGLNEVGKIAQKVAGTQGYHTFFAPGAETPRRSSRATAVLLDKDHTSSMILGLLAAEASRPDRIAPHRWIYGVGYRAEGVDLAHLEFHNHAAIDGKSPRTHRVRQAVLGLESLRRTARFLEEEGYYPVITGDLNTRDEASSPGYLDAGEMFRMMGYAYKDVGLDWMAWNPRQLRLTEFKAVSKERVHSDHVGLIAKFNPK